LTTNGMANIAASQLLALIGLAYLSMEDIRRREISEKHVLLLASIVAVTTLLEKTWRFASLLPATVYIALNTMLVVGVAVAALLGTLGWGDVAALAIIFISAPTVPRADAALPTLMVVLSYYLLFMLAYVTYNLAANITHARHELKRLPSHRLRIIYALIARPKRAREIIEKPGWWYPLNLCGKYTVRFDLYLNPPDIRRNVRQAMSKGCLGKDEILWVTYGIPAIPLLTLAYAVTLALGDYPLLAILGLKIAAR